MRLKAPRLRPLHRFADIGYLRRRQVVAHERALGQEIEQPLLIDGGIDLLEQPRLDLGLLTVADRLDEQIAQFHPLKQATQHVIHSAAESMSRGFELLEQPGVNLALAGVLRDQVPQVTHFCLADTVDAPEALLQPVRVPRQIVIHHQMRALEI